MTVRVLAAHAPKELAGVVTFRNKQGYAPLESGSDPETSYKAAAALDDRAQAPRGHLRRQLDALRRRPGAQRTVRADGGAEGRVEGIGHGGRLLGGRCSVAGARARVSGRLRAGGRTDTEASVPRKKVRSV